MLAILCYVSVLHGGEELFGVSSEAAGSQLQVLFNQQQVARQPARQRRRRQQGGTLALFIAHTQAPANFEKKAMEGRHWSLSSCHMSGEIYHE